MTATSTARRRPPTAPTRRSERADRLRGHGRGRCVVAPLFIYPRVPDEGAVLCAVRLRLQSADRLCRAAVVRPCALLRLGELSCGAYAAKVWGFAAGACHPRRHRDRGAARPDRRVAGDPPAGHLFRHDHAGARADDVLLRGAGAVHRRRGRHPGGAARQAVRPGRSERPDQHVHHGAGDLPRRLPADLSHHPFAVRRGAQGDPRERGARDLARLQDRPLQARGLRAVGDASRASPAAPRRSCCSSLRSPTSTGRCRARWC